jgi:hypothetical protein
MNNATLIEYEMDLRNCIAQYRKTIETVAGPAGLMAELCNARTILALYFMAGVAGAEVNRVLAKMQVPPVPDWRQRLSQHVGFPLPHESCTFENLQKFRGKALWLEAVIQQSSLVAAGYKGANLVRVADMSIKLFERSAK